MGIPRIGTTIRLSPLIQTVTLSVATSRVVKLGTAKRGAESSPARGFRVASQTFDVSRPNCRVWVGCVVCCSNPLSSSACCIEELSEY
jgi:hypothetical protein